MKGRLFVGVTGPMGAGKSTFCRALVQHGAASHVRIGFTEVDVIRREVAAEWDKSGRRKGRQTLSLWEDAHFRAQVAQRVRDQAVHSEEIVLIEWSMLLHDGLMSGELGVVFALTCEKSALRKRCVGDVISNAEREERWKKQTQEDMQIR